MNVMYYMLLFVVIVPIPNESSTTLAIYFMQHVLLKFGLCHLIVLNDGTPLKEYFPVMCTALNLDYASLSKPIHKDLTVEYVHRFLNKCVTIASEGRYTNEDFFH